MLSFNFIKLNIVSYGKMTLTDTHNGNMVPVMILKPGEGAHHDNIIKLVKEKFGGAYPTGIHRLLLWNRFRELDSDESYSKAGAGNMPKAHNGHYTYYVSLYEKNWNTLISEKKSLGEKSQ